VTIEELLGALGGSPPAGGAGGGPSAGGVSGAAGGRVASRTGAGRAPTTAATPASASAAAPAAPAPLVERSPTASPPDVDFPDAASAWQAWLESGRGVPRGLGAFLRSASVSEDPDGKLRVRGLSEPAVERLRDGAVLKAVRDGFALFLGHLADVVVDDRPGARAAASRVTEAEVREGALKALFRQEPRLRRAVEELDLELME